MAKRKRDHIHIGDALSDFIGKGKLRKGLEKVSVNDAWHKVMGEAISKYTTQLLFEGNTLYVQLSSSVLREELSYGNSKIIEMLNEELDKPLVKKLVLR